MITPFDDYPIHQASTPLAKPADGDPNRYDRYYMIGFAPDASHYFGFTLGVYPNRGVIDAAFSVVRDGVQRSVFASGRAPHDRARTSVGPISIEVAEPLRTNVVRVRGAHLGVEAELTWRARTAAYAEPRQQLVDGTATVMDASRLVQWGSWEGWIQAGGERTDVSSPGIKDRSWGIRPVGEPVRGAPGGGLAGGGVFFLWAPVHFDDRCSHLILFEQPDGHRWFESAFTVPVLEPGGDVSGSDRAKRHATVAYDIDFRPGTRRSRAARLAYAYRDGTREELSFEPLLDFQTKGLGYFHPEWAHGWWRGESAEGYDEWKLVDLDLLEPTNFHVQQLCRVRAGSSEGIGILEQLILGPHGPTGFTGYTDGASPAGASGPSL